MEVQWPLLMLAAVHCGAASPESSFPNSSVGTRRDSHLQHTKLHKWLQFQLSADWTPGCVTGRLLLSKCPPQCLSPDLMCFLFTANDLNRKSSAKGGALPLPHCCLVHGSCTLHSVWLSQPRSSRPAPYPPQWVWVFCEQRLAEPSLNLLLPHVQLHLSPVAVSSQLPLLLPLFPAWHKLLPALPAMWSPSEKPPYLPYKCCPFCESSKAPGQRASCSNCWVLLLPS